MKKKWYFYLKNFKKSIMKKILITLVLAITSYVSYAGCSSISVKSSVDKCGNRLSFTVKCVSGNCSCSDLADFAGDFIQDHLGSDGCYHL